jgi:hypothetical protein
MVQHPRLFLASILASVPLIWWTFRVLFPNIREDLEEDGIWFLLGALTNVWVATWLVAKLLCCILLSVIYVLGVYQFASLFFS